jgi:hypothetical protein
LKKRGNEEKTEGTETTGEEASAETPGKRPTELSSGAKARSMQGLYVGAEAPTS